MRSGFNKRGARGRLIKSAATAIEVGLGIGLFPAAGIAAVPQQWIIDGSEVQQSPDGPFVIWSVNGSNVSYIEV